MDRTRITAADGFNFAGGWFLFVLLLLVGVPCLGCGGGFFVLFLTGVVGAKHKK